MNLLLGSVGVGRWSRRTVLGLLVLCQTMAAILETAPALAKCCARFGKGFSLERTSVRADKFTAEDVGVEFDRALAPT